MNDRDSRRISVYDLAGLRIHPNGYRVHQTTDNLNLGKSRQNTQTSRGWIAEDAGGSISMPKYRGGMRIPSSDTGEAENFDVQGAVDEDEEADVGDEDTGSGKRKRNKKYNNIRPVKRRKFFQDDSYISGHSRINENENSSAELEIPSQDLLKNVHFLAARFYDDRGLLENTSKRYRDTRRRRKLNQARSHSEPTPEASQSADQSDTASVATQDQSTQPRRVSRDMYRVLDGSALLAIGMLTQEMVKKLIISKRRSSPQPSDDEDEPVDPEEEEGLEVLVPPSDSLEEEEFTDDSVEDGTEEETDEIEWEDESASQDQTFQ